MFKILPLRKSETFLYTQSRQQRIRGLNVSCSASGIFEAPMTIVRPGSRERNLFRYPHDECIKNDNGCFSISQTGKLEDHAPLFFSSEQGCIVKVSQKKLQLFFIFLYQVKFCKLIYFTQTQMFSTDINKI